MFPKFMNKAEKIVLSAYQLTKNFPDEEKFALISQIRRCAVSIPLNIAEGYGRNSDAELNRFRNITRGSASELEPQMIISKELGYISSLELDGLSEQTDRIQRGITNLQKKLNY